MYTIDEVYGGYGDSYFSYSGSTYTMDDFPARRVWGPIQLTSAAPTIFLPDATRFELGHQIMIIVSDTSNVGSVLLVRKFGASAPFAAINHGVTSFILNDNSNGTDDEGQWTINTIGSITDSSYGEAAL